MRRFRLLTFIWNQYQLRVNHELQVYVLKSLRDLLFLAIEFFIENTALQLVSSFSHNRIPLRDLGYELLVKIDSRKITHFSYEISVEYVAIIWILFCFFHDRKGLAVIQKGARCLFMARTLRVCLFLMTILPSPKTWCNFKGPINPLVTF